MAQTMFGDIFSARQTGMEDLEKSAATLAALQPGRGSVYAAGMAGGMLGRGLGQAFGAQTPMEAKQAKLGEIQAQFPDLDPSNPEQLRQVQAALLQAGLYDQAYMVGDKANEAEKTITERLKVLKPSSVSRSKEQFLIEACDRGNENACRVLESELAYKQALGSSAEELAELREVKTLTGRAELEAGIPGLKGQKISSEIGNLDARTLETQAETGHLESKWELERRETEAKISKYRAETDLKIEELKGAGKLDDARNLTETKNLTTDYDEFVGDWRSRKGDLEIVMGIGGDRNAITDMANIFKFMQILDPTSVVREGEQQLVMDARGILDSLKNVDDKVARGRLLTDTQIGQIQNAVKAIYNSQMTAVYDYQQFIKNKVDSYNSMYGANISLENIIPEAETLVERPSMGDAEYQDRVQRALTGE